MSAPERGRVGEDLSGTLREVAAIGVLVLGALVARRLLRFVPAERRTATTIGLILVVGIVSLVAYTPIYELADPRANCAAGSGATYGSPTWRFVADVVSLSALVFLPLGSVLAATRAFPTASYTTKFILGAIALTVSVLAVFVITVANALFTGMQCI